MRVCGSKLLLREHLPFRVEEVPDDRPHFRPVLWGDLTDPAEQVMVVRQRPAGPPAGDEQQQIGAVLLGRQVDRVGQVRVREERHDVQVSHLCSARAGLRFRWERQHALPSLFGPEILMVRRILPFSSSISMESATDQLTLIRRAWADTPAEPHRSLVEPLIRLLINSARLDCEYLTALPIFANRGPVPESRAFASHETLTFKIFAASFGCRRGSVVLAFTEAFMPPPSFSTMEGVSCRVCRKIPCSLPQNQPPRTRF